jgi:hypothetical protein
VDDRELLIFAERRGGRSRRPGEGAMHPRRRSLLVLNAVGGAAVLASYAWGLRGEGVGAALWGGVPEGLRPLYGANMLLAAVGYFLFTPYVLLRLPPEGARFAGGLGFGVFHALYALVLLPSALWLPLTAHYLAQPSAGLWAALRLDLGLVGLGSLGLLACLLALPGDAPRGRAWAVAGLVPFCLQTALLDALVWPALFPDPIH